MLPRVRVLALWLPVCEVFIEKLNSDCKGHFNGSELLRPWYPRCRQRKGGAASVVVIAATKGQATPPGLCLTIQGMRGIITACLTFTDRPA